MTLPVPAPVLLRPPIDLACSRCGATTDLTQRCAPCGDELCAPCYGPMTALACGRCRFASTHLAVA